MPKKANSKKSVVEQLDDLDDDLELIEDDDEAPAKSSKKNKASATPKAETSNTGMGASWLAEHVNEELGTEYTAANMRVILRKMAKEGDLEREVGTDRARYQFTGEKDPIVRQVLKRIRSGEVDDAKKERIEAARSGKRKAKAVEDEPVVPEKPAKRNKKAKIDEDADETPVAKKPAARRRRKSEEDDE